MRRIPCVILVLLIVLSSGCIRTYKIDVQQGNVVTAGQLQQLKPGMSKREVRYVLGTPLIVDPFRDDRWDYFYSFKAGSSTRPERRRITVVFDNDALKHIQGDVVANAEHAAGEEEIVSAGGTKVTEPRSKETKGFLRRAWDRVFND